MMKATGVTGVWTDEQRAIIDRAPAPTVVFAAPGSGKTSVLMAHVAMQLAHRRVAPAELMAVTFTRQAALEMRRRLGRDRRVSDSQAESVRIGTFHALLFRWLAKAGIPVSIPLQGDEQRALARTALAREGLRDPRQVREFLSWMSRMKSRWPPARPEGRGPREMRAFTRAGRTYEGAKTRVGRWDFDDIPVTFARVLEEHPSLLTRSEQLAYLVVDEFQDTNPVEWHVVQALARTYHCPVFVVGDDDQAIYGFRGASPRWLLEFGGVMGADAHWLSTNFRSDAGIVACAERLIGHNRMRMPKRVRPARSDPGTVRACTAADEAEEARQVAAWLEDLRRRHPSWQFAVMARTRVQLLHAWRVCREKAGGVEWRTFHDGKGREWDAVAILGAVEPNPYLANQPETTWQWEEERRLFYVALTRARHVCGIWTPVRVSRQAVRPIRFVHEMGCELDVESPGSEV